MDKMGSSWKDKKVYAGLEETGHFAQLFFMGSSGNLVPITHSNWMDLIEDYGAEAGDCLVVEFHRQEEDAQGWRSVWRRWGERGVEWLTQIR